MNEVDGSGLPAGNFRLDEIERDLRGGLRFANLMASVNQEEIQTAGTLLNALVEILVGKGLIHISEIEDRKVSLMRAIDEKKEDGPRVQLVAAPDKFEVDGCGIDCGNRRSLCRSACCTFWFPLSLQDLDEGVVKWDFLRPYGIARGDDGYCLHIDRQTLECGIYDKRPAICRSYSCRDDRRVWESFENHILNRELAVFPPALPASSNAVKTDGGKAPCDNSPADGTTGFALQCRK